MQSQSADEIHLSPGAHCASATGAGEDWRWHDVIPG
jgi:hypothetical protein